MLAKRHHLLLCVMSSGFIFQGCKSSSSNSATKDASAAAAVPSGLKLHPLEQKQANEDAMIQGISDRIARSVTTHRDAHPKAHACVYNAQVQINPELDTSLQKGIFANPGKSYEAIIRFSSGSSNSAADDRAGGGQGLALKVILDAEQQRDVEDLELVGEVQHTPPNPPQFLKPHTTRDFYKTFDIISIDGLSEFVVDDLSTYGPFFNASAKIPDALKAVANSVPRKTKQELGMIVWGVWEKEYLANIPDENRPIIGKLLQTLGAVSPTNLLKERYNSWVPYAFDETRAVKYSFVPCTDLSGSKHVASDANFLAKQLRSDLDQLTSSGNAGCFQLVAQFHDNSMPSVEHASYEWGPEASRKYVPLATVRVPNTVTDAAFCEALSFNPSHALPNQRGIGATQRARRVIYAAISNKRTTTVEKANGVQGH